MNSNDLTAEQIIEKLSLAPLPFEGGYFRQTFKAAHGTSNLGGSHRAFSTAIYYLVTPENFSALHRVKSDEIFHFYAGDSVEMIQISPSGELSTYLIGSNLSANETPQVVVPKDVWQGLRLINGGSWALMGTTVAPGFEYEDFELGKRAALVAEYPQFRDAIMRLTRD